MDTLSQIKKNLAANLESVAQRNSNDVDHTQLEEFHELLTEYMDILMKNGLKTKDFTYHNLKGMLKNKNLVALIEDQDWRLVIMDKLNYACKSCRMIEEGINNGVYASTNDTALEDVKLFESFLHKNFQDY